MYICADCDDSLLAPEQQHGNQNVAGAPAGFQPAASFAGARPGFVFRAGPAGTGYYPDTGAPVALAGYSSTTTYPPVVAAADDGDSVAFQPGPADRPRKGFTWRKGSHGIG